MVDASSSSKRPRTSASSTSSRSSTPSTAANVHPMFLAPSQQPIKRYKWLENLSANGKGCGHFVWDEPVGSSKVAAFDIDGTVIEPKSGAKFPKDEFDWKFLHPEVAPRLRQLHKDGYAIVFITNQAGQPKQQEKFKRKMPLLCANLDVPLRVFAAFDYDHHRKSSTGMWDAFVERFNGGVEVDYEKSFYIGDAAGRNGDHNDTDRKMADNCGLPFFTPEEFFLGKNPLPFTLKGWNSKDYDHNVPLYSPTSAPLLPRRLSEFDDVKPEVVLFVGFPGVGKTSFFQKHFAPKGYVHVNQDTLKSRAKCLKTVSQCLSSSPSQSCVVDNTSPSRSVRQEYLNLIRTSFPDVKVRCFWFSAPQELAMHNSIYRAAYSPPDAVTGKKRDVLPYIAFSSYKSNFEQPTIEEGFDELKTIRFKFEGSDAELRKWQRWLIDVYGKFGRRK